MRHCFNTMWMIQLFSSLLLQPFKVFKVFNPLLCKAPIFQSLNFQLSMTVLMPTYAYTHRRISLRTIFIAHCCLSSSLRKTMQIIMLNLHHQTVLEIAKCTYPCIYSTSRTFCNTVNSFTIRKRFFCHQFALGMHCNKEFFYRGLRPFFTHSCCQYISVCLYVQKLSDTIQRPNSWT